MNTSGADGERHDLTTDLDRLERELARYAPTPPSPELLGQLREIRRGSPAPSHLGRTRKRVAILTGLAASAAVALGVLIPDRGLRVPEQPSGHPTVSSPPVRQEDEPGGDDEPRSTLLAYRRALARSSEEFDTLLAREAAERSGSAKGSSPVLAYGHGLDPLSLLEGDR